MDEEGEEISEEEKRRQLFEYAALGREVDDFMHSGVGRYLMLRVDREYADALKALSACSAFDSDKILGLQSDAKRALNFRGWLTEAINTGLMAEHQLEGRQDEVPE
jgi:hypothetical protein